MKKSVPLFSILLLLPYIFFCTRQISFAQEKVVPKISRVSISKKSSDLILSFFLENGLTPKIRKVIESGIPVIYVFEIKLKRRRFLMDEELVNIKIRRTISFDNLKDRYFIYSDYPISKLIGLKDVERAREYLLSINGLRLLNISKLKKGNKYLLQIKAKTEKEKGSMPFSGLIGIFASFGFETDTYEVEFIY